MEKHCVKTHTHTVSEKKMPLLISGKKQQHAVVLKACEITATFVRNFTQNTVHMPSIPFKKTKMHKINKNQFVSCWNAVDGCIFFRQAASKLILLNSLKK